MRSRARSLVAAAALLLASPAAAAPPAVVFIMLDTTRADHLSALGNPRPTTPALDDLAAHGVLFRRHFANAHATRPSFPQLMSGRYYHQNILRDFMPDGHPREMSFAEEDPATALLPEVLRRAGYRTIGASAHLWVTSDSPLGRHFDALELLRGDARQGYAVADQVVDRGIALWRARDPERPLFLYLHFMDMHIPRFPPDTGFRFPVAGYDWTRRFRRDGEALFDRDRRRWDPADARDFTDEDRAHFAAVYDDRLARTDAALGRLLEVLRHDDPGLAHTLVVVVADHGEELGEAGRTHHTDSLADAVQHVPLILAGANLQPGQSCSAITEHVDLLPTILGVLGVSPPPGVQTDGVPRIAPDGTLARPCGGGAAYFAWEDYRAIRAHHYLLEQRLPGSARSRCDGHEHLYRVDGLRRHDLSGAVTTRRLASLRRSLETRLDGREQVYLARRWGAPHASFLVRTDFWQLDAGAPVQCVPVGPDSTRSELDVPGWLWSGRGFTVLDGADGGPLPILVRAPVAAYQVELAATGIPPRPWLFGFGRWLRKSFLPDTPSAFLPLGTATATAEGLRVLVPAEIARGHHVLGVRLTPPGARPSSRPIGDGERERLKALGYVQ